MFVFFLLSQFDSAEDSQLLAKAAMWQKMLREKHAQRNYAVSYS